MPRPDMTEEEYIAILAKRCQDPDMQALINSFPPLEPDQLAVVSRIMGKKRDQARQPAIETHASLTERSPEQ